AVVGVGSATIAAAIGAGGLGEYIYRGLSMVDTTVILAGAIPAAALAVAVDGALLWLEKQMSARRRSHTRRGVAAIAVVGAALARDRWGFIRSTTRRANQPAGGPGLATSSSSGPTAFPVSPTRTGSAFRRRPA